MERLPDLLPNTIFNYPYIHWCCSIWATNGKQKTQNKRRLATNINNVNYKYSIKKTTHKEWFSYIKHQALISCSRA